MLEKSTSKQASKKIANICHAVPLGSLSRYGLCWVVPLEEAWKLVCNFLPFGPMEPVVPGNPGAPEIPSEP